MEMKSFSLRLAEKKWLTIIKFCTVICLFAQSTCAVSIENKALVIGVSQYSDVNSLKYADADASQYAQYLTQFSNFKSDNVTLLLNQEATKKNIQSELEKIANESNSFPIDDFFFVYAGHGVGSKLSYTNGNSNDNRNTDIFLVPTDAKINDSDFQDLGNGVFSNSTFITVNWLSKILSRINAKKIIIILDSCYSGNLGFFENLELNLSQSTKSIMPRVYYVASSKENQTASEFDELKHGALSYAVFEFLKKKGREITKGNQSEILYGEIQGNIETLFNEIHIDNKSLSYYHQPMFLGFPNSTNLKLDNFLLLQGFGDAGINESNLQASTLQLEVSETDFKFYVDGSEARPVNNEVVMSAGKHMFEFFLPETGYRYSFVKDISNYQISKEVIKTEGVLFVNSKFDHILNDSYTDIKIRIDGSPIILDKDFSIRLKAGSHLLEVSYLDAISSRNIEIRPDSPLRVIYNFKSNNKMQESVHKIKNVQF